MLPPLRGIVTASTAVRGQWIRGRGGTRGRDKIGTGQAGLWGVSCLTLACSRHRGARFICG